MGNFWSSAICEQDEIHSVGKLILKVATLPKRMKNITIVAQQIMSYDSDESNMRLTSFIFTQNNRYMPECG